MLKRSVRVCHVLLKCANRSSVMLSNRDRVVVRHKMSSESIVRDIWRNTDAVCFDVDSTVCRDEAIDELAKFANKEKEVMEMY